MIIHTVSVSISELLRGLLFNLFGEQYEYSDEECIQLNNDFEFYVENNKYKNFNLGNLVNSKKIKNYIVKDMLEIESSKMKNDTMRNDSTDAESDGIQQDILSNSFIESKSKSEYNFFYIHELLMLDLMSYLTAYKNSFNLLIKNNPFINIRSIYYLGIMVSCFKY